MTFAPVNFSERIVQFVFRLSQTYDHVRCQSVSRDEKHADCTQTKSQSDCTKSTDTDDKSSVVELGIDSVEPAPNIESSKEAEQSDTVNEKPLDVEHKLSEGDPINNQCDEIASIVPDLLMNLELMSTETSSDSSQKRSGN